MTEDARFSDGVEQPLRLKAMDEGDLKVVSALVQDAVFPASEMQFDRKKRRFAVLLNRFRWEDRVGAERRGEFERVQTVMTIGDVLNVSSQGVVRGDADTIMSVLSMEFEAGEDGAGDLTILLAGDGGIRLSVEALDVTLHDATRPYVAPSGKVPDHPE